MTTMKAGRINFGTKDFRIIEVPIPDPGPGQVRIKVGAAGVCLSDVHLISGLVGPLRNADAERTLGHEVAGTVDALGAGVEGWTEGNRVTLQAVIARPWGLDTMGVDYDGGWAEYVVVPQEVLVPIPDAMPFEQACIIPDAVSTPWAAICHTAKVQAGEAVGVWGAGGLGIHAVQLLRMIGAGPLSPSTLAGGTPERPAARRRRRVGSHRCALRRPASGASRRRRPRCGLQLRRLPRRRRADPAAAEPGRTADHHRPERPALTVENSVILIAHQQQILGHYGYLPPDVAQIVRLTQWGRLDLKGSVSSVLPLEQAPEAVRQLEEKDGNPIRLVLVP